MKIKSATLMTVLFAAASQLYSAEPKSAFLRQPDRLSVATQGRAQLVANLQPAPQPESLPPGRSTSTSTPATGLTLLDLEAIALGNNPTLSRAAARVRAAQGQWVQVGLPPNPSIGYLGTEIGQEGTAGQQGGFIGQQVVTGGKLRLNRAVASQEIRQAQRQMEVQRLRVLNDVRVLYFEVLIARRTITLAEELLSIGEKGRSTTQQLLDVQEASRVDLLQSRIERNSARILLQNANNRYSAAWRSLAAAMGVPDMPPTSVAGEVEQGIVDLTWEEALARIQAASPELAAARASVDRARAAIRRAQAERIPNVDAQGSAQYDNVSQYTFGGAQIGVSVPLFDRNQGGIRRAQAELTAAISDARRVELSLHTRLAAAFERYANTRQQVDQYRTEMLPDARSALDLANLGYREGQFGFLDLLNAQRTYFQTNLAYIESLRQLRISTVQIEGLLLTDSLQDENGRPAEWSGAAAR